MSQKSRKGLSLLSKHMSAETQLQLDRNTVTERLIIPCLATANPYPTNGEIYYDTAYHHIYIYFNGWVQVTNV